MHLWEGRSVFTSALFQIDFLSRSEGLVDSQSVTPMQADCIPLSLISHSLLSGIINSSFVKYISWWMAFVLHVLTTGLCFGSCRAPPSHLNGLEQYFLQIISFTLVAA